MIGDFLYQLTARDGQSPLIEPHADVINSSGASMQLYARHTVEPGYCYLFKTAYLRCIPGAAQSITQLSLAIEDPSGKTTGVKELSANSAGSAAGPFVGMASFSAGLGAIFDVQFTDLLLPQGWGLLAYASFTAAGVANAVSLQTFALRIPRGNISAI